jgi:predicted  nucleic acid-binding Zn-ribbon protein
MNWQKHYEAYEKGLEMLKLKNERLGKEILSRDARVRELEKMLSDVQREKERYEDSYYAYMHK